MGLFGGLGERCTPKKNIGPAELTRGNGLGLFDLFECHRVLCLLVLAVCFSEKQFHFSGKLGHIDLPYLAHTKTCLEHLPKKHCKGLGEVFHGKALPRLSLLHGWLNASRIPQAFPATHSFIKDALAKKESHGDLPIFLGGRIQIN